MKTPAVLCGIFALAFGVWLGSLPADATPAPDDGGVSAIGPDVIVGAIPGVQKWGSATSGGVTVAAYSIATTSCNIGDQQLLWQPSNPNHPVIPQNAYRVRDGRIEQIGMSWIKHGFCALQQSLCGPCQPAGGGCPPVLGVGCSDPYSASLNGDQTGLGPRSQVNAATGAFPYPFWSPSIPATIGRRLQIAENDLNPTFNAGAEYFFEAQYVHPQDAANGNGNNNASYRKFTVGSFSSGTYTLSLTGPTVQQIPAIFAWKSVHPDVLIEPVDVPSDGRFHVGFRAIDIGDGLWRYEYAVHNLNSDRSGASFSIPIPAGVSVTDVGFKDINYHSNEPYDPTDWVSTLAGGTLTWASTQTFAQNPNANALRWATLYNFWFISDSAPAPANAQIGLFKPGTPTSVSATVLGPSQPPFTLGDLNFDGVVNGADLAILLGAWLTPGADLNGDGTTDGADLSILLGNWTP
ncbi:MAG: hypothetical protein KF724_07115 [Phycisphaeraceae bacterium]|nr:hypothetical protein [Phycisphaeraceae bacterium]